MIFRSSTPSIDIPRIDVPTFLLEILASHPVWQDLHRPVYIDATSGETVTVEQYRTQAHQLASGWQNIAGLKRGQVVAIVAPNDIHYTTVLLSVLLVGGILTLINPQYTDQEIVFQLEDSQASFVVLDHELAHRGPTLAKAKGISNDRIYTLQPVAENKGVPSVFSFATDRAFHWICLSLEEAQSTTAYLCYSSGTTGRSKGVMLTHYNMVANICQIDEHRKYHKNDYSGVTEMGISPFFHSYGLNTTLHLNILEAKTMVVVRKFQLPAFLASIERYYVHTAYLVPPVVLAMARHPIISQYDLSALKLIICGGAPLSKALACEAIERLNVTLGQGYGLTELSPVAFWGHDAGCRGSNGTMLPNIEAKILGPSGQELGRNEQGEICIRGPNVMKGYLNNPEVTKDIIDADGFLHTGDVGYIDDHGELFTTDRVKELIKYKGFQVPPAELEALIITHEKVADVVVIGVYDEEQATELPKALVVLKVPVASPELSQIANEIIQFVKAQVVHYKRLRGGVAFIDEVPRSAAGKILRRLLKEPSMTSSEP